MVESGFECKFYDLKYFEVSFFFFHILEFTMKLRASLEFFVENHQVNIILFQKKNWTNSGSISPT